MPSISLLLKRKITGAPRALITYSKKFARALKRRLWVIAWGTLSLPLYFVASVLMSGNQASGLAGRLLKTCAAAPGFVKFVQRKYIVSLVARGAITEATKVAMKLVRLSTSSHDLHLCHSVWNSYVATIPSWLPFIDEPRASYESTCVVVVNKTAEPLFDDVIAEAGLQVVPVASLRSEFSLAVLGESELDLISTAAAKQLSSHQPRAIVAAPSDLLDVDTLLVAVSLSHWAQVPLAIRDVGVVKSRLTGELEKRTSAKAAELKLVGNTFNSDRELLSFLQAGAS
jgi:hypothetical protein